MKVKELYSSGFINLVDGDIVFKDYKTNCLIHHSYLTYGDASLDDADVERIVMSNDRLTIYLALSTPEDFIFTKSEVLWLLGCAFAEHPITFHGNIKEKFRNLPDYIQCEDIIPIINQVYTSLDKPEQSMTTRYFVLLESISNACKRFALTRALKRLDIYKETSNES